MYTKHFSYKKIQVQAVKRIYFFNLFITSDHFIFDYQHLGKKNLSAFNSESIFKYLLM